MKALNNSNTTALILSITSSLFTAIGFICVKLASIRIEKRVIQRWYTVYMHPLGFLGILFLIAGLIVGSLAVDIASIILLASTPCFTLVFNSLLSPCMLGEKFMIISEILGTFILLVGSMLCIMCA